MYFFLSHVATDDNSLAGPIPADEMAVLTDLTRLTLKYNNFTGTLPKSVFELTSLELISVNGNSLTGNIPSQAFSISSGLSLGHNQLTGSIPPEIGQYAGRVLILNNNLLTGSIPEELYTANKLRTLYMNNNMVRVSKE